MHITHQSQVPKHQTNSSTCSLDKEESGHLSSTEWGKRKMMTQSNMISGNKGKIKTLFCERKIKRIFNNIKYLEVTTEDSLLNTRKNMKEEILEYQENVMNNTLDEQSGTFFTSWTLCFIFCA